MLGPRLACESEIELELLEAFAQGSIQRGWTSVCVVGEAAYPIGPTGTSELGLVLYLQRQLGPHRVDFTLTLSSLTSSRVCGLVVECDGHDYHDRTKEQASRDRRRDRALQTDGWRVFRFTGSDIWHDAGGCVAQCFDFLAQAVVA